MIAYSSMKKTFFLSILFITFFVFFQASSAKGIVNGSFEKRKGWQCDGCTELSGEGASWLFGEVASVPHKKKAATLIPTTSIYQKARVPKKNPSVGLTFKYYNTGAFTVSVRDVETDEEYAAETINTFQNTFTKKNLALPKKAQGRNVWIRFTGEQYTSYIDRVRFQKLKYPISQFYILTFEGEQIENAKVWFTRNGATIPFKVVGKKGKKKSVRTNSSGATKRLRIVAPPRKTKICAKKGEDKKCVKLFDTTYFNYGTDAEANIVITDPQ